MRKNQCTVKHHINILKEGELHDKINMITTAFGGINTIARNIQSNQREDVRSVAVLLYSGKQYILALIS